MDTPFGPCIQELTLPGDGVEVAIQNPFAMLWQTARSCEAFRKILQGAIERAPPRIDAPWSLIFYFDEVTPTNPLARGRDMQNTQHIYWTFLEFGELWDCNRWFTAAAIRAHLVEDMPGGMSRFFGLVYDKFFEVGAHSFKTTGCALDMQGTTVHMFAVHRATIADFKGHCQVLNSMGQRALKPCPICRNVINHALGEVELSGPHLLPLHSLEFERWTRHSDASRRALAERLARKAAEGSDEGLEDMETLFGYRHNAHSIVHKVGFQALSTLLFDWQHIWCQVGVFDRAMTCLMETIHELRKGRGGRAELPTFEDLHVYLQLWQWPGKVSEASRCCETGKLNGTSSETLSVAPVLAAYFRDVVAPLGGLDREIRCFIRACDVMEALQSANRSATKVTPDTLLELTLTFLRSHVELTSHRNWVYKFHQSIHLPLQWAELRSSSPHLQDMRLCSCFALERKHKDTKKRLHDRQNPQSRERCVLEDLTLDQWHAWETEAAEPNDLLGERGPSATEAAQLLVDFPAERGEEAWAVSRSFLTASGEVLCEGDFVLVGRGCAGIVQLFYRNGGRKLASLDFFEAKRLDHGGRVAKFKRAARASYVDVARIHGACAYKKSADVVTACVPLHLRDNAF